MIFIPFLLCKNCPSHICLPLPFQGDAPPHSVAWPWGSLSAKLLCPSCWQINRYWAEDCRWDCVENTDQLGDSQPLAVHRIVVPCGSEECPSMLYFLAMMPLNAHVYDAADLVEEIDLNGIACDRGHQNYHSPKMNINLAQAKKRRYT